MATNTPTLAVDVRIERAEFHVQEILNQFFDERKAEVEAIIVEEFKKLDLTQIISDAVNEAVRLRVRRHVCDVVESGAFAALRPDSAASHALQLMVNRAMHVVLEGK